MKKRILSAGLMACLLMISVGSGCAKQSDLDNAKAEADKRLNELEKEVAVLKASKGTSTTLTQ